MFCKRCERKIRMVEILKGSNGITRKQLQERLAIDNKTVSRYLVAIREVYDLVDTRKAANVPSIYSIKE